MLQWKAINMETPNSFPLLGKLCIKHRITRRISEEPPSDFESSSDDPFTMPLQAKDRSYNKDDLNSFVDSISTKVGPVKYQINSTQVHDLSSSSLRYHKRKYDEALEAFKFEYARRAAPGQENEFLESVLENKDSHSAASYKDIPSDLSLLVNAYNTSETNKQKIIVLSAMPSDKYTKNELMNCFKCSEYIARKSRELREKVGPVQSAEEKCFPRKKLNVNAARHFV